MSLFSIPALTAINHVLDQSDWAMHKLQPFAGRNVRIALPPFSFSFEIDTAGRLKSTAGKPDLDISLPAQAPLLALQDGHKAIKAARITGPVDLADALSFVLTHLRWDIEEDLAKVFGDIAAHRIAQALDQFIEWQRQAADRLAGNFSEYFVEESPMLVRDAEIMGFAHDVARLRDSLATMDARIERAKEKTP